MAKLTIDMPMERLKEVLAQLTPQELAVLLADLQDRLETLQMMKLAEPAFAEWSEEEDLYGHG